MKRKVDIIICCVLMLNLGCNQADKVVNYRTNLTNQNDFTINDSNFFNGIDTQNIKYYFSFPNHQKNIFLFLKQHDSEFQKRMEYLSNKSNTKRLFEIHYHGRYDWCLELFMVQAYKISAFGIKKYSILKSKMDEINFEFYQLDFKNWRKNEKNKSELYWINFFRT